MAALHGSTQEHQAISALALDGSTRSIDALSELYIIQEAASRRAFNMDSDLRGEDIRPCDMFDIIGGTGIGGFYAVLLSSLNMTVGQAIQSHLILERRLFRSDAWNGKVQQSCVEILNDVLDEISEAIRIETSLESIFEEKNPKTKCFICVINPAAATTCRLIRNYRPRTGQNPQCTIRQVIHATLSNQVQLPTVYIQEERFLSALDGYANPTHILVKELRNGFTKGTQVACLVNVGAGHPGVQLLSNSTTAEEITSLLRSCQLVAEDVATQCHDLGPFFFRLSPPLRIGRETHPLEDDISSIKGLTVAYTSTDEISTRLDDLEDKLWERFGAVSIERLSSVAGKDGESRIAARLAKIEQHLDDTIFKDVSNWLQPVHQTSKLDANIKARSGTTCRWLLENLTFQRWMSAKGGLFWFHGLMGTGKTVMSSFIIETLRARNDIYVAYYYFEFTNPATLSEEALLNSLISQLAAASPSLVRTFYQKHNNGGLQPQLSSLQTTLNGLVSSSSQPIFIIIDALDELPVPQRKCLLESLVAFSQSDSGFCTHLMTTSREEVDIQREFETVDFELGVQGDLVRQDIAAFVDRQLEAKKWMLWPRDEIEMMRRLLNERADGQFRMVACQLDILQQVKSSEHLRESLRSLPKSLRHTYDYILERIPVGLRVQAHRLFAILSVASATISVDELSILLAVDIVNEENGDDIPIFRGENQFHDPLDVVDLGTSLVSRVDHWLEGTSGLQLAHASVKEHLLNSWGGWFSLREDLAHSIVARSCLALVSHFHILQHQRRSFEPYSYSRDYWFRHTLPDGPVQLLRQQQFLYTSFPWPYLSSFDSWPCLKTDYSIISAAHFGLFDLLKTFLNARVWEPEVLTGALVEAARSSQTCSISLQCCILLVSHNVDINTTANDSFPLQSASSGGYLEVVQFLIEKGAEINAVGGKYGTALQAGARGGHLEIVQFLFEKGAEVNVIGGKYGTAIQAGAFCGNLEIVQFLAERGAEVNVVGGQYWTALQAGTCSGNLEVVQFLVERGADVNVFGGEFATALQAAAITGTLEIVQFLVESGADVNAVAGKKGTALQAATSCGDLEIVRFLVKNGAGVNVVGGERRTALHAATVIGSLAIVRFLVENGADVNIVRGEKGTVLQVATALRDKEIAQFLVENGAVISG